jgi:hypothetical protein
MIIVCYMCMCACERCAFCVFSHAKNTHQRASFMAGRGRPGASVSYQECSKLYNILFPRPKLIFAFSKSNVLKASHKLLNYLLICLSICSPSDSIGFNPCINRQLCLQQEKSRLINIMEITPMETISKRSKYQNLVKMKEVMAI